MADSINVQLTGGSDFKSGLPRQITDSVFWLGACVELLYQGRMVHQFMCPFLIRAPDRSLLVDTGSTRDWQVVLSQIDDLLGGADLDFIAPTHHELAHSGNLQRLLQKYPKAVVIGDLRDYHLIYPDSRERFKDVPLGDSIDLGGGFDYFVLPAPIRDLPSTVWGYERANQIMFVGDGFAYLHPRPELEELNAPVHLLSECARLSTELPAPQIEDATFLTRVALLWSKYVDPEPIFAQVDELLAKYPTQIIAPAHGNVITNPEAIMPIIREAFLRVYKAGA